MSLKCLWTIIALLGLSACVETASTNSAKTSQTLSFMTQSELLETIPGSTLSGTAEEDGNTKWTQAYSKGGESGDISGLWGGTAYKAKWSVKDNMWCESSEDFNGCWNIVKVNDKLLQPYKNGTTKTSNPWVIQ